MTTLTALIIKITEKLFYYDYTDYADTLSTLSDYVDYADIQHYV